MVKNLAVGLLGTFLILGTAETADLSHLQTHLKEKLSFLISLLYKK